MKTLVMTAAALVISAPAAFAAGSTVGEGVVVMSGPNAVSMPAQMSAVNGAPALDVASLILLESAQADDDSMAIHALRTAPETVSTQGVRGGVNAQLVSATTADVSNMSLSDAAAAYLGEVAD